MRTSEIAPVAGGTRPALARTAWSVLALNLAVIAWGAYVRASGSGAGCGAHWPLCNGQVLPLAPQIATMIEFTHRMMSGFVLLLNTGLLIWTYRVFTRGSLLRTSALLVFVFTITEALLGAGLVLFQLVAHDASVARALAIMAHLVNTFMLIGSIAISAFWATFGIPDHLKLRGTRFWLGLIGVVGVLTLGASGAVTALGDTLFPAASLSEAFNQDLSPTAHFLIRLRVFHPMIAISVGVYIGFVAWFIRKKSTNSTLQKIASGLFALFLVQLILGTINVFLLAPIWMQIIHLLVSDLIWIMIVLITGMTADPIYVTDRLVDHEVHNRVNRVANGIDK
jgi:heme A synthase